MDENTLPPVINPEVSPINTDPVKSTSHAGMKIIVFLLGLLVVGGGIGTYFIISGDRTSPTKTSSQNTPIPPSTKLANNTIVYGYWQDKNSYINSYDLSTSKNKVIAILSSNVKHVKVISPTKIMYINKTNERDYGSELVVRDLIAQKDTVVATADVGYGIDDYIVSPDGNLAAIWEVAPPPQSVRLSGGRSRVISLAVNDSSRRNTLYDESTLSPVHYPVAVLNNGDVYTDRFLPNANAGWAYGMSFANFSGSMKEEVVQMSSGSYSSQPIQSPGGGKLAFAGYDGKNGVGTDIIGGFRKAITTPNTVEVFDLNTRVRTKIASATQSIYPSVYWDSHSNNPLFTAISKESSESGEFMYDIGKATAHRLAASDGLQSSLTNGALLIADQVTDNTALGNLGSKYSLSQTAFYVQKPNGENVKLDIPGTYLQLIAVKKGEYFSPSVNVQNSQKELDKGKQLSLQTLAIKPKLSEQRTEQQSESRCRDVAAAQCNQLFNTAFTGEEARKNDGTGNADFDACFKTHFKAAKAGDTCSDSPLYLYGIAGTKVKVDVGTVLYSPNVPFLQKGFDVILEDNGRFKANGKSIGSLAFEYSPAIRVSRPTRGIVVEKSKIHEVISSFGRKLGLNAQEIEDTTRYAEKNVAMPYAFISFFDHATSQKILPLYFDPHPDTYRNIVFYIEGLSASDRANYELPLFEKIERKAFTAVEISFIVR